MEPHFYGEAPIVIGNYTIDCKEMMFYQYLPIKLAGDGDIMNHHMEDRISFFRNLIIVSCLNFVECFGKEEFNDSYVYLTAKHLYQSANNTFNRKGYHSDGFMTNDVNYIWSDKNPTVFNKTKFELTMDDSISMREMEEQALSINEFSYPENTLLRLNQFNIHKVAENIKEGMRTFVKISFSRDKYDLIGNSHNYKLDYNWEMKNRNQCRNIPQSNIGK